MSSSNLPEDDHKDIRDTPSSTTNLRDWLLHCWSSLSFSPEEWEATWPCAAAAAAATEMSVPASDDNSSSTPYESIPLLYAFLLSGSGETTIARTFPSSFFSSSSNTSAQSQVPPMETFTELDEWIAAIDEEGKEMALRPMLQFLQQNLLPVWHRCGLIVRLLLLQQGIDPLRPLSIRAVEHAQQHFIQQIERRAQYASGGYYTPTVRILRSSLVDPPTSASFHAGLNAIEIAVERAFFPALAVLLQYSAVPSNPSSSNPNSISLCGLLPRTLSRFHPSTVLEFLHEKDSHGDNSSGKIDNLTPLQEEQRIRALHVWTQMPFDHVSFNSNCVFLPLSPSDLFATVDELHFSSSPSHSTPWLHLSYSQRAFLDISDSPMGVFSSTLLAYWTACTVSELVWRGADLDLNLNMQSSNNHQPISDSFLTHLQLEMLPSSNMNAEEDSMKSSIQVMTEARKHVAREISKEESRQRERMTDGANCMPASAQRRYISSTHRRLLSYLRIQRKLLAHARYATQDSADGNSGSQSIVEPLPRELASHFSSHPFAPHIAGVLHGLRRRDLRIRWLEWIFAPRSASIGIAADIVRNHIIKYM